MIRQKQAEIKYPNNKFIMDLNNQNKFEEIFWKFYEDEFLQNLQFLLLISEKEFLSLIEIRINLILFNIYGNEYDQENFRFKKIKENCRIKFLKELYRMQVYLSSS